MSAVEETTRAIAAFAGRGAGTDAERRAAVWVADELRRRGRKAEIETFWCRPNWALAQAWHVALGVAGSLVAAANPKAGAAMLLAALLSILADASLAVSPGRWLTPEHASQNVVSRVPSRAESDPRLRLIVTANLDAGRQALIHRPRLRRPFAELCRRTGGRAPGWAAWLSLALVWTLATALVRNDSSRGTAVAIAQLVPTVGLVVALALLLEAAGASWSPGAGDNGSGVAVALALARALDAAPPAHASVELVLTGSGDGQGLGLRRHLRSGRRTHTPRDTVVVGIGPCAAGRPAYVASDGPLVPLGFSPILRHLCATFGQLDPQLGLREARRRGSSPALPARMRGLPAITIGALDDDDLVPYSHTPADTLGAVEPGALDAVLRAGLLLADAVDGYLATATNPAAQPLTRA